MRVERFIVCVLMVGGLAAVGCRTRRPPPPEPAVLVARPDRPLSDEERNLREHALEVQVALDARAEADAIRRFREYLARNNLTFTINTYRMNEDRLVASPTVQPFPVRAVVEVYRGRERLHQFVFIPKDNQNLALLIA